MSEQSKINMRLVSLCEKHFCIEASEISRIADDVHFSFSCGITPNYVSNLLEFDFGVRCGLPDGTVLMECVYRFVFEVSDLRECVVEDDEDKMVLKNIAPHIFSVAIGTMRGVIAEKAARTELSKYPLPMLNPMDVANMLSVKEG